MCLHQKDKYKTSRLANKKASPCKLLGYDNNRIYWLLTLDNCIIRSKNVEFDEQESFEPHDLDHLYSQWLRSSRAKDTLDLWGEVPKARQLEKSTQNHSLNPRAITTGNHIDDCLIKLKLPVITKANHKKSPNSEYSDRSELNPSRIRFLPEIEKERLLINRRCLPKSMTIEQH